MACSGPPDGRRPAYAVPMPNPYAADIDSERTHWYEVARAGRRLEPESASCPATTRAGLDGPRRRRPSGDLVGRGPGPVRAYGAGTYEGHDVDIDGLNATLLGRCQGQPWEVAWVQAKAARTRYWSMNGGARRARRRGRVVDPQVRRRALPRACRAGSRSGSPSWSRGWAGPA